MSCVLETPASRRTIGDPSLGDPPVAAAPIQRFCVFQLCPNELDAGPWHCGDRGNLPLLLAREFPAAWGMNTLEVIQAAATAELVDEDGDRVQWNPLAGLTGENISALEAEVGFKLPQELRDLLPHCSGIEARSTGSTLPAASLSEVVRMYQPPHRSLIDDVHEDRLFNVWRKNPGALAVAESASRDETMRAFAATLDDRFTIVDQSGPAWKSARVLSTNGRASPRSMAARSEAIRSR
jgi:hypothetical protein